MTDEQAAPTPLPADDAAPTPAVAAILRVLAEHAAIVRAALAETDAG